MSVVGCASWRGGRFDAACNYCALTFSGTQLFPTCSRRRHYYYAHQLEFSLVPFPCLRRLSAVLAQLASSTTRINVVGMNGVGPTRWTEAEEQAGLALPRPPQRRSVSRQIDTKEKCLGCLVSQITLFRESLGEYRQIRTESGHPAPRVSTQGDEDLGSSTFIVPRHGAEVAILFARVWYGAS